MTFGLHPKGDTVCPTTRKMFFLALTVMMQLLRCDSFRTNIPATTATTATLKVPSRKLTLISNAVICFRRTTLASPTSLCMSRTNKQRREDRNRYQKNNRMLDFIDEPMSSEEMVGDANDITAAPEDDELSDLVRCIVRAADGRKADNIVAMRVRKISTVTSFVVFVSGNSRPQNQAITANIKDGVDKEFDLLPGSSGVPEGSADSGWTVLDYGSVMVHVMTPKSRLFYNVEGKWKDQGGEVMDITDCLVPNTPITDGKQLNESSNGKENSKLGLTEEEDPFWS